MKGIDILAGGSSIFGAGVSDCLSGVEIAGAFGSFFL